MESVNALKLRNNRGQILDRLSTKDDPILISKGRKIGAVLVTPEDFESETVSCLLADGLPKNR